MSQGGIVVGAYQFEATNDIAKNWMHIKKGILMAASEKVDLLVFPECALTGYPPIDMPSACAVNFELLSSIYLEIQELSTLHNIYIIVGSILKEDNQYFNSALIFQPNAEYQFYNKRALWGWDKDNFIAGKEPGIININNLNIGVRSCYEVRFPEYFRELYKKHTFLNVILFYDTSGENNPERYDLIMGHIRTRAVENVCCTLTVNTAKAFQTAPTCLVDKSGHVVKILERQAEELLVYELADEEDNFGEKGRKEYSDFLVK